MDKMSTLNYVTDDSGATFIPATQRADGTWRKARRVKEGYVPQEEMPLYESKGKQWAKSKPTLPPGLHLDSEEGHGDGGGILIRPPTGTKSNVLIGNTPTNGPTVNNIPGLSKSAKKNAKRKEKKREKHASSESSSTNPVNDVSEKLEKTTLVQASKTGANSSSDPVKRAKNLKKKLREIEILQQKIDSGELPVPDKDQLEKIGRRSEIERELEDLELSD